MLRIRRHTSSSVAAVAEDTKFTPTIAHLYWNIRAPAGILDDPAEAIKIDRIQWNGTILDMSRFNSANSNFQSLPLVGIFYQAYILPPVGMKPLITHLSLSTACCAFQVLHILYLLAPVNSKSYSGND
jgi:hypothetical protein